MSNMSAASILAQEEVVLLQQGYINAYCSLAVTALVFYEYIVTFPEEVHVIWGVRLTTVTVIFALNRYLLMVQGINSALTPVLWHTPLAVIVLTNVMTIVVEAVTASFSAFRTYAISGHQIVPAMLVLLLGLAPVAVNVYTSTRVSYAFVIYIGSYPLCGYNNRESIAIQNKLILIMRICAAASDLIVLLVTWFKTSGLAIEVRRLRLRGSMATVLIRDGEALLLLNILEIVIKVRYENSQNYAGYVTIFLPPISSILISRFILNLRQVSLGSMGLNTISHSTLNTRDFTSRLVGNFGADVQHTSLVFENVKDSTEDEQSISVDCEAYELAQVQ
ncbi:uncharacterized protein LAESUDRAFT_732297 [Laetiporus sulphureus 93-53]|uniref:DUF6533 domain-containing protein n=1 Tax=Laetiporus sulphureus 93-53 TaxID=1314785 RepID=A0A165B6N8_9APHY|nr:uncharacterized protein LAESUDRAFT_732297 [Laetiporus sulphureus 93-53]KZT00362.1 hypothetical protein LAESUDRAFT_732297 [Laetiporus sulphureus 93-53]